MVINDEPLVDPMEAQKYRTGVGTLLYVSSERPDVQYHVKEETCRQASSTNERRDGFPDSSDRLHEGPTKGHPHQDGT